MAKISEKFINQKRIMLLSLYTMCLIAKGINVPTEDIKNNTAEFSLEKQGFEKDLEQILSKKEKLDYENIFSCLKEIQKVGLEEFIDLNNNTLKQSSNTGSIKIEGINLEEILNRKEKIASLNKGTKQEKIGIEEMIKQTKEKQKNSNKNLENKVMNKNNEGTASLPMQQVEVSGNIVLNQQENSNAGISKNIQEFLTSSTEKAEEISTETIIEEEIEMIYYDLPCPLDWQDYIYQTASKYQVPSEIAFTIFDQESDGKWDNNGVISDSGDYGVPQINIGNKSEIQKGLGYSMDEILYDPYKGIEAGIYWMKVIMDEYGYTIDNYDSRNIFGTYNGWKLWYKKRNASIYAESCMQRLEQFKGESRKLK